MVMIDELAALTAYCPERDLQRRAEMAINLLCSQGRAPGFVVFACLQDPRKEVIPSRGLFTQMVGLRLKDVGETSMVLGEAAVASGCPLPPDHPRGPGHGLRGARGRRLPGPGARRVRPGRRDPRRGAGVRDADQVTLAVAPSARDRCPRRPLEAAVRGWPDAARRVVDGLARVSGFPELPWIATRSTCRRRTRSAMRGGRAARAACSSACRSVRPARADQRRLLGRREFRDLPTPRWTVRHECPLRLSAEALRERGAATRACASGRWCTRSTTPVTRSTQLIPTPCGATRESKCPPCAQKNRRLRMQQCREGWHLDEEPERHGRGRRRGPAPRPRTALDAAGPLHPAPPGRPRPASAPHRAADRRQGVHQPLGADLPAEHVPDLDPALVRTGDRRDGTPRTGAYDYRRAALDALHFPKLVDRFWQNLRRAAGLPGAVLRGGRGAAPVGAASACRDPRRDPAGDRAAGGGRDVPPGVVAAARRAPCTRMCCRSGRKASGYVDPTSREPLPTWERGARRARCRRGRRAGARDAVRRARSTCRGSSRRRTTPTAGWPT